MPNISGTRYGPSIQLKTWIPCVNFHLFLNQEGADQVPHNPRKTARTLQNLKGNGNVAFAVSLAMTNPRSNCSLIGHVIVLYHFYFSRALTLSLHLYCSCLCTPTCHIHVPIVHMDLYSFSAYATFRLNLCLVFCRALSLDSSRMFFLAMSIIHVYHHDRLGGQLSIQRCAFW